MNESEKLDKSMSTIGKLLMQRWTGALGELTGVVQSNYESSYTNASALVRSWITTEILCELALMSAAQTSKLLESSSQQPTNKESSSASTESLPPSKQLRKSRKSSKNAVTTRKTKASSALDSTKQLPPAIG